MKCQTIYSPIYGSHLCYRRSEKCCASEPRPGPSLCETMYRGRCIDQSEAGYCRSVGQDFNNAPACPTPDNTCCVEFEEGYKSKEPKPRIIGVQLEKGSYEGNVYACIKALVEKKLQRNDASPLRTFYSKSLSNLEGLRPTQQPHKISKKMINPFEFNSQIESTVTRDIDHHKVYLCQ